MKKFLRLSKLRNQRGVTAIVVCLLLFALIGFSALAIDLGHLYVARNELKNAADAGALAGAQVLYIEDGTVINTGANQTAYDTATANKSEGTAVEVDLNGNTGDVQRGHWSFGIGTLPRGFTPNASTFPVDLWNVSTEDLDANPDFINAVRVKTKRVVTPVASFFARIFGYENFKLSQEAVGYIGFAGKLTPSDVDQPIAICKESILQDGKYTCNIGRMINSGGSDASGETGGWTSFSQDNPCTGGTNAQEVIGLVCGNGNPNPIELGKAVATNGGQIQSAFTSLESCWINKTNKTLPWNLTLLVVECPGNNITTCQKVVGAVNVNIVWITGPGEDPSYSNAPTQMGNWSNNDPGGQVRWNSFVQYFKLQNVDGTPAPYQKKSIYFLPDCTPHEPTGVTGGENFGIRAKIPVLVN